MPGIDDSVPGAREQGLQLSQKKTATGAAAAVTINALAGTITTEALTTAAGAEAAYTVTNNKVTASSIVLVSVADGTNTTVAAMVASVTPAAGSFVVVLSNLHAAAALNGTLKINFVVI